jgi:tetratricopeptide (TPR) repeat protein
MKKASLTLSGNNQDIVADALNSVKDRVDICILIDTGITDNTIEKAREIVGDKLVVKKYNWKNDFSEARNRALECAAEENCDLAIMCDTDERMIWADGEDLESCFVDPQVNVSMMYSIDRSYCKERVFRIPVLERYYGPTHETFPAYKVGFTAFPKSRFWELPKTAEQYHWKFTRDLEILLNHVKQNINDPRWFYYLGDTYKNLGRFEEAIEAYHKCWQLNGWDEESAWSCFRAAECAIQMKQFKRAIELCSKGICRHPGLGELMWLAGWCWYQIGVYSNAEYCARYAITAGIPEGFGGHVPRIGFRVALGQFDGPYDLLRWSLIKQNKPVDENLERKIEESRTIRNGSVNT